MIRPRVKRPAASLVLVSGLALLCCAGCEGLLDTSYGRSRGESINGTGVVANLFRESGHKVRTARRLSQELDEWADVIIRFAPVSGPPEHEEVRWYNEWLSHDVGRALVYVPRDYEAQVDYWSAVLEGLARDAPAAERTRAQKLRDQAQKLRDEVEKQPGVAPSKAKETAAHEDWFAVEVPNTNAPKVCKVLAGPWGRGIDAQRAALPRHATLKVPPETSALLTGDGRTLVIERERRNESRVLVVASGAFLLNAPLVNAARRPLALRVVDWVGESPRKVAFVEGGSVLDTRPPAQSIFALLRVPPFGWVAAQMFALGLAACLARARLGRARLDPPSDADRPAAHAEALGSLLARTGQPQQARAALDAFRQWRKKAAGGGGAIE